jgi:hypothetical protein
VRLQQRGIRVDHHSNLRHRDLQQSHHVCAFCGDVPLPCAASMRIAHAHTHTHTHTRHLALPLAPIWFQHTPRAHPRTPPGTAAHRQLSQTVGGSSSSSIPGCAVYNADGSCARCSRSLLLNVLSGRCTCAAGAYAADSPDVGCVDCFKGSWCPGGPYAGFRDPGPQPCGDSLTTLGRRAFTNRLCGEQRLHGRRVRARTRSPALRCLVVC